MISKRQIYIIILAVILIFSSCDGSGSETSDNTPNQSETNVTETSTDISDNPVLKIPYDFGEGLRPYSCSVSSNRYVNGLVFRSFIDLKTDYQYSYDILSEIRTDDNVNWYLYIEPDQLFPDGSELTAYDLKYSIQCAMSDDSYYKSSLDVVSSITIVNATCLKVSLLYADRFFPNLLYFPVIEYGTENKPVYFPDRYSFSEDGNYLICNISSYPIQTIQLCDIDDHDLLTYEMRMGKYDCIYVSDPLSIGASSVGAIAGLQSNKMVYLGLNSTYGFTYYSDFRKAISSAIDYKKITEEIYSNYSSVPKGIYSEVFYENQYVSSRTLDLMSASLLLDDLGYTSYDSDGYRLTSRGKRVSVKLLVCNENTVKIQVANSISNMLKELGIYTEIASLSYQNYITSLKGGNYDIYIAEVKMDPDMDISKLITPNAYKISTIEYIDYGMPESEALYLKYLEYMSGTCNLNEFLNSFTDVTPYIPLCYLKSCAIFSRDKTYSISGTAYDMFYNIENWQ